MSDAGELDTIRARMRAATLADEATCLREAVATLGLDSEAREAIVARAVGLVNETRAASGNRVLESFLVEYGLSTREGVALMCLAEALLRVPDAETIDALIEDKIAPSDWGRHLGNSSSVLVNASTWALLLTGKVLGDAEAGLVGALHGAVKRLGEPVVRAAVAQSMRELGHQFVLGRDIAEALERAAPMEARGYTYSYDMLGEAARTEADARRYHLAYSDTIAALAGAGGAAPDAPLRDRPGISVKLSALHPRYEMAQRGRVMSELVARASSLALLAKSAGVGLNVDAEEADRLDLSLDVIEAVLADRALAGWDGFGVVVQAYSRRAPHVLDWLHALACRHDRRIMVRLVKGAYWDAEIKRAQVLGLDGYPVFTRKAATDASFLACARKLLAMGDRIYAQLATHNAHTMAAVLHLAGDRDAFEFQRLHGMGEALHEAVHAGEGTRCRIYAPVGAHRDLLAYLVRRLLENGANSSFVNQIVDESVAPETIARDPIAVVEAYGEDAANPRIPAPAAIFGASRCSARGYDLTDPDTLAGLDAARGPLRERVFEAGPLLAGAVEGAERIEIRNPARTDELVGRVTQASSRDVGGALAAAREGLDEWSSLGAAERARRLRRVGELYEAHAPELFALAAREAGKTLADCVAEVREAVDFTRYYANEALALDAGDRPLGVVACISPWNFPLAIFTGQIAGVLAAGNAVVAKPAEQTPLIAARATALMHEAGIPRAALQLLPGDGPTVGAALVADPRVAGVCFTGSTETAQAIHRAMAEHLDPDAPLVAETGGLNAMIVDSTALPEQAVRDIVASAFQSAGQRCSALRVLYVQSDVAERVLEMLYGAMDELVVGDPWLLATDVGPVIDAEARAGIEAHCAAMAGEGRVDKRVEAPAGGHFVAPTAIRVPGIEALEREVFGPVLHVATFEADAIDAVIDAVNARGYGLTFGLHTRIDDRVQHVVDRVRAGNLYVNRNQIGAVVGSQPFGGEGLSGTGPKAGGPHYVRRFTRRERPEGSTCAGETLAPEAVQRALDAVRARGGEGAAPEPADLPGPTGESNRLSMHPRGVVLCLGPGRRAARAQVGAALAAGNAAVLVAAGAAEAVHEHLDADAPLATVDGHLDPAALAALAGFDAVACAAEPETQRALRRALAARDGPIVCPIVDHEDAERFVLERHVCVDTTAAGGNASLLAGAED